MQSVSLRIWTHVAVFISYDDNNYTTGTSIFSRVLVLCEMQSASSRIWTRIAVSISYVDIWVSYQLFIKIFSISYTRWEWPNFYYMQWKTRGKTMLQGFSTNSIILSNQTCFGFSLIICEKFSTTTSPRTSDSLTPQNVILLIIMCGVQLSERPTKRLATDELKAMITAALSNLNEETVKKSLQEIPKSSGDHGRTRWRFLWINLIYSISRYFHMILVYISDKLRRQCYFHFFAL